MKSTGPQRSNPAVIRTALKVARPCWPHLAGIALLSLLSAPVTLLAPLPLKIAVDSVLGTHACPAGCICADARAVAEGPSGGLLICVTSAARDCAAELHPVPGSWLLCTYTGEKLVYDLRGLLLFRAQRFSLAVHDRRGANDIAYRIQYDAPAIQNLFLQGMVPCYRRPSPLPPCWW